MSYKFNYYHHTLHLNFYNAPFTAFNADFHCDPDRSCESAISGE